MDTVAPYKLLIVDNEPFIVEELCEFFTSQGYLCTGCQSTREALELFHADPQIAIVLSDLYMPEMTGIQLIQTLREQTAEQRLFEAILFTGQSDKQDVIMALRTGFADYHQKPLDLEEVLASIEQLDRRLDKRRQEHSLNSINQRLQALTTSIEELCMDIHKIQQFPTSTPRTPQGRAIAGLPMSPDFEKLSPRQLEVAQLIVRGMTNYQIACELGISENTVKLYVSQILRITNMHNRTQLALALLPCAAAG